MTTFDFTPPKLPRPQFKHEDAVLTQKYLAQNAHYWAKANGASTERGYDKYSNKAEAAYAKAAQYSMQLQRSDCWHDR